jgi:hypothetical protein
LWQIFKRTNERLQRNYLLQTIFTKTVDMNRQEALETLAEIKDNINTCCAITMEPDEVLALADKLENYIKDGKSKE